MMAELFGYELENLEWVLTLYILALIIMFYIFKYWISISPPEMKNIFISYGIITALIGLPVSYFIVNYYANKE